LQKITITDVAREAGVSIKTVSRVFNSEPNVREATRSKVVEVAERLGYHPNLNARRLAANRSFLLGLLYDNPLSEYAAAIQLGAIEACKKKGFHLLIHPIRLHEPNLIESTISLFRQSTVDGFILIPPVSEHDELLHILKEKRIPFVNVSQRPDPDTFVISVDDAHAAFRMTEKLIELGHQKIGFIKGHPDHGSSHDRYRGYQNALKKYGIAYNDLYVVPGMYDFESGYSGSQHLLGLPDPPTAIFASNDHMALGVLTWTHEIGIPVPGRLSICGFDDSTLAQYAWPSLTTLRQPIADVGELAAETLIAQLFDRSLKPSHVTLQSELITRESTGPLC